MCPATRAALDRPAARAPGGMGPRSIGSPRGFSRSRPAPDWARSHASTCVATILTLLIPPALPVGSLYAQAPIDRTRPAPGQTVTDEEFHLRLDDATDAETDKLIPLLGSPAFPERERATERLTEIGAPAFARLRLAYHDSDDLEVRLRIEQVVREAYINRHVFERFGFLGISRKRNPGPTHGDDPRIPKGNVGIAIETVIEETAAHQAGLQAGDVIIAKDGSPFQGDALVAFVSFAVEIRESGAGTAISLTVLRGDQQKQIDVVLGRIPRSSINQITGLPELYETAMRRLDIWWFKYFRKPPGRIQNGESRRAGIFDSE